MRGGAGSGRAEAGWAGGRAGGLVGETRPWAGRAGALDSLSHPGPREGGRARVPCADPHPAEATDRPVPAASPYPSVAVSRPAPGLSVVRSMLLRLVVLVFCPPLPSCTADVRQGCVIGPFPARPRVCTCDLPASSPEGPFMVLSMWRAFPDLISLQPRSTELQARVRSLSSFE